VASHLQDEADTPLACQQCAEQLAIHRQDALVECVWHATPAAVRKSPATDHLLLQIGGLLAKTTRAVRG